MKPVIFTKDVSPKERRILARKLLKSMEGYTTEEEPKKEFMMIGGEPDLVYNAAAVKQCCEAIIAADGATLNSTVGMDFSEVMEKFVFSH